jgi:hypothetical protein
MNNCDLGTAASPFGHTAPRNHYNVINKEYLKLTTTIPQPYTVDFARPLGGLEHFFSLIDQHRPVHFAMAAQIEGPTSIPAWRTALDKLQVRHPLLRVSIEMNVDEAPHFRTIGNIPIPLRVTSGPTVSSWQEEVARELATPFDLQQAPLARAVLMHGQNKSVFILTTHHSIADGLSSAYAIRDVLRALAGENLEPLPSLPALEPLVYMSEQTPNGSNESGQPEPLEEPQTVTFRTTGGLPRVEALSLTPGMTRALIERARKERTTVHTALCSALVLAGRECHGDWNDSPVRVMSPFNLRKELGIGEDCGLFVWAAIVAMSPRTPADVWNAARLAKSSLTGQQSPDRVATGMKGLEQALNSSIDVQGAAQILEQGFPNELLVTNLGNLSVHFDCGNVQLKALWGPSVLMGFEGEQTVGVTTTNDSLCLLHTSFTPIPSLLPRAAQILQLACE